MPDAATAGAGHNGGVLEEFRALVRDCTLEEYQAFVDVLVERASPDDPERAKYRDFLLHNFGIIYETGGVLKTPKGDVTVAAPRTELANQDQHDKAVALSTKLAEAEEAEENVRKAYGAPLFQGNKRLIDAFDPRIAPLERARKKLKGLIGEFLKRQSDEKAAAERAAREEQRRREKAAEEAAAQGAHNAAQLAAEAETARLAAERKTKAAAEAGKSRSATGGGSHLRVTYDVKVTNFAMVPAEFKMLDREKALIAIRPHPDGSPGRLVTGLELITNTEAVVRK